MPKNSWSLPDFYDENVKKAFKEITEAFRKAKKSIPREALDALAQGNWQGFLDKINWQDIQDNFSFLSGTIGDAANQAAFGMYRKAGVGAKLTFDIIDAYSVKWASDHAAELVTNITNDMQLTIRRTITEASLGDITWQQAAEQIGEYIPLTERDAQAVSKYHDRMLAKYIERKGWREKEARKYAKNLASAYAEKLSQSRARTIARTEIATAATQGEYIGWQAGVETGMIDAQSTKEWIAEPTACEDCHEMDGKTFAWDEEFPILGGRLMPPAHPNCRCAAAMLPPDYGIPELENTFFTDQALSLSKSWWNQFEIEFAKHLAGKHDQSSHGHGHAQGISESRMKMPEHSIAKLISESDIADKYPFVGLSDKAKEIRSRISLTVIDDDVDILGRKMTRTIGEYTTETGKTIYLIHEETLDNEGHTIDATVGAYPNENFDDMESMIGSMEHFSIADKFFVNPPTDYKINRIEGIGVDAPYQRQGIATAMVEFARTTSPNPIFHSSQRTDEGVAFSTATKSLAKAITEYLQKTENTFQPTNGMKSAAKRALRWKQEGKATGAGTPVGWGRATDIVAGRGMSIEVVRRMYSFFSRHEVDKQGKDFDNLSNPSNGRIMWDAWGGDAGFSWSRKIVERDKRERKSNLRKHLAGKHDQSTHGSGKGNKSLLTVNLPEPKFESNDKTIYRGMVLTSEWSKTDFTIDELADRMTLDKNTGYGRFWSSDPEVGQLNATGDHHLNYNWAFGMQPKQPVYGVMIEAKLKEPSRKISSDWENFTYSDESAKQGPHPAFFERDVDSLTAYFYRRDVDGTRVYVGSKELPVKNFDPENRFHKHLAGLHDQSTHGHSGSGEMHVVSREQRRKEITAENAYLLKSTSKDPEHIVRLKGMLDERIKADESKTIYEKNGVRLAVDNKQAEVMNLTKDKIEAILDAGKNAIDKIPTEAKKRLAANRQQDDYLHADVLIHIPKPEDWTNGMATAATFRNQLPAVVRLNPDPTTFNDLFDPNGPSKWWHMTSTFQKQPRILEHTIHHEIGHAIDTVSSRNPMGTRVWQSVVDSGNMKSAYGSSSEAEGFAEAWADFVYNGRTNMSGPYIDLMGWDK